MPNWRKLIQSGSNAELASLTVDNTVTTPFLSSSYVDLDGSTPTYAEGRLFYDSTEGALSFYNEEEDITLQIGQEFYIKCQNATSNVIPNGTPVKITGASGDNVLVSPAIAENHVTGSHFENHIVGLATHDISANGQGYVTTAGVVRGLDTSDFQAGDSLYLQTGSAGVRNTPPPFPYDVVVVGYVERVQQNNGEIFVMPKQPSHISTLSGVSGSNGAVGDLWVYQDNDAWSPSKTLSGSYTVSNGDWNVDGTVQANTFTGSLLRLDESGTGLRMTNVGAFDNSSGNFRIFSNNDLVISTNGDSGTALTIESSSKKSTFVGDIVTTALTASGLNYPDSDGSADQVLSTDGNGNLSFNDISDLSVPSFLVFGQEDTLTGQTTAFEMKTTNGAQVTGWRMPVGGSVTHITLQLEVKSGGAASRNITAELYKNNVATGKSITVDCSSNGITGGNGTITTETFNAGDRLTLYITHNNVSLATGDHAGLVRILTSTA